MKLPKNLPEFMDVLKSIDKIVWAYVAAGVLVVNLLVVYLVIPSWIDRPRLHNEVREMNGQIQQANALEQKRKSWEKDQKIFEDFVADAKSRLFKVDETTLLLSQIAKMASLARIEVLSSKPLDEKMVLPAPYNQKYQPAGYQIAVQGGYHEIGNFVSRIENNDKLLRVQSVQIEADKKSEGKSIAELKIWAILEGQPAAAAKGAKNGSK